MATKAKASNLDHRTSYSLDGFISTDLMDIHGVRERNLLFS